MDQALTPLAEGHSPPVEGGGVSLGRIGNKIRNQIVSVFPGGSNGKESACSAGDPGLIPGLVRFPGDGNGYPLQYSCLENSMEFSWAIVHEVAKSQTQLSNLCFFTLSSKESSCYLGRNEIFCLQ